MVQFFQQFVQREQFVVQRANPWNCAHKRHSRSYPNLFESCPIFSVTKQSVDTNSSTAEFKNRKKTKNKAHELTVFPCITCESWRALSAAEGSENQTNPNPLEFLVTRSFAIDEPSTVPYFSKCRFRVSSLVTREIPPTKSFASSESIDPLPKAKTLKP